MWDLTEKELALIQRTKQAFADVEYPGDDHLAIDLFHWESEKLAEEFKGKHWSEISQEMADYYKDNLPRFTPEAFRFYLPAFIIAAFRSEVDIFLLSSLAPPASEDRMEVFLSRVNGLSPEQKAVVKNFVEITLKDDPFFVPDVKERALRFWGIESSS